MGRHHTNPPKPGTHPPNGEHRHKGGPGTASPTHRTGANKGGTGNQTPPTPAGPTNTGQTTATRGGHGGAATTIRTTTNPPPTPPHSGPGHPATRRANKRGGRTTQSCGGHSTGETPSNIPNLEAKPGRANGTAPQGVRESRKPPQHTTKGGPRPPARPPPPHTHTPNQPTHARARDHARNNAHAPPRATTRTHASAHKRHSAGDNTRTPQTSTHTPTPATTRTRPRTRASYCARLPSNLRSFMFQQSSGR